ncbi:MAG: UDP-2,3-diacylglucosamine diphosphatase LpxI [Candidatus Omnitrophica bacterium]|nr:UDP-2,3-diacylglucosamine diphosphatase LpxI [Candidatus Omnitrophota bacterium]
MSSRIALIAGAGRFPLHVAQEARRQGVDVLALGLRGWVDPALAGCVDAYEEVAVGQLGRLIDRLKAEGIREAIMAGKVTKEVLVSQRTSFDGEALSVLGHVRDFSVSSILGAIGTRLASEGITLLDSSTFLHANVCPRGPVTSRAPAAEEQEAIRVGVKAARAIAALDIGQTVVVKGRVVVAVEALEGTDAAIRRAHALAGQGLVVVKTASPNHDRRFDLPVLGLETAGVLTGCGVSCVAVEAGVTLLLDREALIASLNRAGVSLVGLSL